MANELIPSAFPPNNKTRVGLLAFSSQVRYVYNLLNTPADGSRDDLIVSVQSLTPTGGSTNTRLALEIASNAVQTTGPKVLVLFTDGTPSPEANNVCAGTEPLLDLSGVDRLLIVRIGDWDPSALSCILENDGANLFTTTFADLQDITDALQVGICEGRASQHSAAPSVGI